jgi:hypothetical protein
MIDALPLPGVLRLVQSLSSPRASRIKCWLADAGAQSLDERNDPEPTLWRLRRLYERRGYERQWIDQRLRSLSARHELVHEWHRRGVRESDQFRTLTNLLISEIFGMDVEAFRRFKGLDNTGQSLRDHMTDLELALASLGEATAVTLSRARSSHGFEALVRDVQDAGRIAAQTRSQIERQSGYPVARAAGHYSPKRADRAA